MTIWDEGEYTNEEGSNIWLEGQSNSLGNYIYKNISNGTVMHEDKEICYTYSKGAITISKKVLYDNFWSSGDNQKLVLSAYGYEDVELTVSLSGLCNPVNPSNIANSEVKYDSKQGLMIKIADSNFRKALTNEVSHISLNSENDGSGFGKNDYKISGEWVIISNESLILSRLEAGNYRIMLRAYGYGNYVDLNSSVDINILKSVENIDVTHSYNDKGDLVLEFGSRDYVNNLVKPYTGTGSYGRVYIPGYSWIYNVNTKYGKYDDLIVDGNKVVIGAETLINNYAHELENGYYNLTLEAYGYENINLNVPFAFISPSKLDMEVGEQRKLSFDVDGAVTWSVDNENAASVDNNGLLTAKNNGIVRVKAQSGDFVSVITVKIGVVEQNVPIYGGPVGSATFETDDHIDVKIAAGDSVYSTENSDISAMFDVTSSNVKAVSVNSDGSLKAVSAGTATITVKVKEDGRKTSFKVTVVNRQAVDVKLYVEYDGADNTEDLRISDDYVGKSLPVSVVATDKNGKEFTPDKYVFTSSDTSLAEVKLNKTTGEYELYIKKAGQFTVGVTVTGNFNGEKPSDSLIVRVLDYTPSIETNKLTLNKYYADGASVSIYTKYESSVEYVKLVDGSGLFDAEYDTHKAVFTLKDINTSTGTRKETIEIKLYGIDKTYRYDLGIAVSNSLPSVTVKTYGTYNTFTNESNGLALSYTVKNGTVSEIEFVNDWSEMDYEGNIRLSGSSYSGKVRFYFEDYNEYGYVEKTVSFKTVKTTPKYKPDTTVINLYVPEGSDISRNASIRLMDGADTVDLSNATVLVNGSEAEIDGNTIRFDVSSKGKYTVSYKENGWNDYLKYTVNVSITNKLPTLKAANTVTLNKKYNPSDKAALVLSDTSISLTDMRLIENQNLPEGLSFHLDGSDLYFDADESVGWFALCGIAA